MNRRLAACATLLVAALLQGCALFNKHAHVSISSDPPGARILVNAVDSGFVTPTVIALEIDQNNRIDLERPGYVTATRILTPDKVVYALLWRDMYVRSETWNNPLWLNMKDFFVPIKIEGTLAPSRIHVHLDRTADG